MALSDVTLGKWWDFWKVVGLLESFENIFF